MARTDFVCDTPNPKPNAPIRGSTPLERCVDIQRASGDTFVVFVHDGLHDGRMGERFGFSNVHDLLRWLNACASLITTSRPHETAEPGAITPIPPGMLGGFGSHA
jgi:hypothetical protein